MVKVLLCIVFCCALYYRLMIIPDNVDQNVTIYIFLCLSSIDFASFFCGSTGSLVQHVQLNWIITCLAWGSGISFVGHDVPNVHGVHKFPDKISEWGNCGMRRWDWIGFIIVTCTAMHELKFSICVPKEWIVTCIHCLLSTLSSTYPVDPCIKQFQFSQVWLVGNTQNSKQWALPTLSFIYNDITFAEAVVIINVLLWWVGVVPMTWNNLTIYITGATPAEL